MLNKNFSEMPLNARLEAQIKSLENVLNLYLELEKKDYKYHPRVSGIFFQLEALYDLRDAEPNNSWFETYEEDLKEYSSNAGTPNE
jgi:aromatic ring hydroxylase